MEYQIIRGSESYVEETVRAQLDDGWKLHEHTQVLVLRLSPLQVSAFQAMTRETMKPDV